MGGTNPSLLEAMACECNIAAHKNSFNKAVLGEDAWYFSNPEDVANLFKEEKDTLLTDQWKKNNTEKIKTVYNWDKIINSYEQVFHDSLR